MRVERRLLDQSGLRDLPLIGESPVLVEKAAPEFHMAESLPFGRTGGFERTSARAQEAAYRQLGWVRLVASRMADSFAALNWHLYKPVGAPTLRRKALSLLKTSNPADFHNGISKMLAAGDLVEIVDHPILSILSAGNSLLSGYDQRKLTAASVKLSGGCYWLLQSRLGRPHRAFFIPRSWCRMEPQEADGTYWFSHGAWSYHASPDEVIPFRDVSPERPYGRNSGLGVIETIAPDLDMLGYVNEHLNRHFRSDRAEVVIHGKDVPKSAAEARVSDLNWQKRGQRRLPMWLSGTDIKVESLPHGEGARQDSQIGHDMVDDIISLMGYFPALVGRTRSGGADRSKLDGWRRLHSELNTLPLVVAIREQLRPLLAQFKNLDACVLATDNPIPQDPEFLLKAFRAAPYAPTVDDWRQLQGLAPTGLPVHMVREGYRAVDDLSTVEARDDTTMET